VAADAARFQAGEEEEFASGKRGIAVDRGGELLAYAHLADPSKLNPLIDVYRKVIDWVDQRVTAAYWPLRDFAYNRSDDLIKKPIDAAFAGVAPKGAAAVEGMHRQLAIEIGRFFALIAPDDDNSPNLLDM